MTLLAFAADRRATVDMDRKAAASAVDAPCSNRSMSPACGAHSSKPAARRDCGTRSAKNVNRLRFDRIMVMGLWPRFLAHPVYSKFEVSRCTRHGAMQKMGRFGVVWGHARSWTMSPFDRAHTTSYSTIIETMYHLNYVSLQIV